MRARRSMLLAGAVRLAGLTGLTRRTGLALRRRRITLLGTRRVGGARLGELAVPLHLGRGDELVHGGDRAGDRRAAGRKSAALQLDQGGLLLGDVLIEGKVCVAFALR